MDRYSKVISRATRWARSGVDGFRGAARYVMAVLIWSAAVLWIAALIVVATGGRRRLAELGTGPTRRGAGR